MTDIHTKYIHFRNKLVQSLLDHDIEDGITHPGEDFINTALDISPSKCQEFLSLMLFEYHHTRPSVVAFIVRCIGRLEYHQYDIGCWGINIAGNALHNCDTEVREAGIRALEHWGGYKALSILKNHRDSIDWLNEYVNQVIIDLSKE